MTPFNKRIEELEDKYAMSIDAPKSYQVIAGMHFRHGANAARELMQEEMKNHELFNSLQAYKEMQDKIDCVNKLLVKYLRKELCYETSCPYPCRAMCSNESHRIIRAALNKIRGEK